MRYSEFIFESYSYDIERGIATFSYSFDGELHFTETVTFSNAPIVEPSLVNERALQLAFIIGGVSYYKTFPTQQIRFSERTGITLTKEQADFFNEVYLHGLSQFIFENNLTAQDIGTFPFDENQTLDLESYDASGILALQSGGKDSLLLAELLKSNERSFSAWYMTNTTSYTHPHVLDSLDVHLRQIYRHIDKQSLKNAAELGGLNGHVPVTFIALSYALIDAVLNGENIVLASIGREGEEPHAYIGDLAITHQWSKTWKAETLFSEYVRTYVAASINVGSPLRGLSELRIAELFVERCWQKYAHAFSSCNVANYKQGHDNTTLSWCGNCPKCANSYLLFAPFVAKAELDKVIGDDLFKNEALVDTFKGLLSVGNVMKPFECVGEVDELRRAYHMALARGHTALPFDVPESNYDYRHESDAQDWARKMIQ